MNFCVFIPKVQMFHLHSPQQSHNQQKQHQSLNYNPVNNNCAYSATTSQQSDICPYHFWRDKHVSNFDSNVAGSC